MLVKSHPQKPKEEKHIHSTCYNTSREESPTNTPAGKVSFPATSLEKYPRVQVSDISDYWKKDLGLLPFMPTDNVQEIQSGREVGLGGTVTAQHSTAPGVGGAGGPGCVPEVAISSATGRVDGTVSCPCSMVWERMFSPRYLLSAHGSARHSTLLKPFLGVFIFIWAFCESVTRKIKKHISWSKSFPAKMASFWPRNLGPWTTSWRSSCGCVPLGTPKRLTAISEQG